jgi:hypothetical protein
MERSMDYRGYQVTAKPKQLKAGSWTVEIDIARQFAGKVLVNQFSAANTFPTEAEAITYSLDFGQRIIDGKVPEIPTSELP